jgi:hypothetical protein
LSGSRFARIKHNLLAIGSAMQKPETSAAKTGSVRLNYREHRSDCDCSIKSIAAFFKNCVTGFGGERMRGGNRRVLESCLRWCR